MQKTLKALAVFLLAVAVLAMVPAGGAWAQGTSTSSTVPSAAGLFQNPNDAPSQIVQNLFLGGSASNGTDVTIFGSGSTLNGVGPIQAGLRLLLSYYSYGMLVLGSFLLLYYLLRIIAETAHTGRPGGKANQLWGPIRMVLAIGLLVPLPSGLNSGQMIIINLAGEGSALASNAWNTFIQSFGFDAQAPAIGDQTQAAANMFLTRVCADVYDAAMTQAGLTQQVGTSIVQNSSTQKDIVQYGIGSNASMCGQVTLPDQQMELNQVTASEVGSVLIGATVGSTDNAISSLSTDTLQTAVINAVVPGYWTAYQNMANSVDSAIGAASGAIIQNYITYGDSAAALASFDPTQIITIGATYQAALNSAAANGASAASQIIENYTGANLSSTYGWLSAGVLFIALAKAENVLNSIISNIPDYVPPTPASVAASLSNNTVDTKKGWAGFTSQNNGANSIIYDIANALASAESIIGTTQGPSQNSSDTSGGQVAASQPTSAPASGTSTTSATSGCYDANPKQRRGAHTMICPNAAPATSVSNVPNQSDTLNKVVAPVEKAFSGGLLQWISTSNTAFPFIPLIAEGHTLLNLGMVFWGVAIIAGTTVEVFGIGGSLGTGVVDIGMALGTLCIVPGFFLAYVLGLLPFIRFIFAVFGWLLAFAEAVISIPIFALAHLDPEGEGVMPQATKGGYHLLLQLLFRPILVVLGLITAILMIYIMMGLFNSLYVPLIKTNTGGEIEFFDQLVFMVIHSFIAYTICNGCLKAMDYVPNHALRWIGQQGDSHDGGEHTARVAGAAGSITNAATNVAGGVGRGLASIGKGIKSNNDQKEQAAIDKQLYGGENEKETSFQKQKAQADHLLADRTGIKNGGNNA